MVFFHLGLLHKDGSNNTLLIGIKLKPQILFFTPISMSKI